jgi:hypothetical protein
LQRNGKVWPRRRRRQVSLRRKCLDLSPFYTASNISIQKYMQLAKADRERYYREHLETYGTQPYVLTRSKSQK